MEQDAVDNGVRLKITRYWWVVLINLIFPFFLSRVLGILFLLVCHFSGVGRHGKEDAPLMSFWGIGGAVVITSASMPLIGVLINSILLKLSESSDPLSSYSRGFMGAIIVWIVIPAFYIGRFLIYAYL